MTHVQNNTFNGIFHSNQSAFTFINHPLQACNILPFLTQNQHINPQIDSKKHSSQACSIFQALSQHKSIEFEKNSTITAISQQQYIRQPQVKYQQPKESGPNQNISRLRSRKPCKYDFDSEQQEPEKQSKACQTKNIIKNFIRSLISFIKKYEKYTKNVLKHLEMDQRDFEQILEKIQGKINTISELRELWSESKFSSAFRVMSNYFLRKYYPKHIFRSRIFNFQTHLKYRVKLLASLEIPQQFSSLKYF